MCAHPRITVYMYVCMYVCMYADMWTGGDAHATTRAPYSEVSNLLNSHKHRPSSAVLWQTLLSVHSCLLVIFLVSLCFCDCKPHHKTPVSGFRGMSRFGGSGEFRTRPPYWKFNSRRKRTIVQTLQPLGTCAYCSACLG